MFEIILIFVFGDRQPEYVKCVPSLEVSCCGKVTEHPSPVFNICSVFRCLHVKHLSNVVSSTSCFCDVFGVKQPNSMNFKLKS